MRLLIACGWSQNLSDLIPPAPFSRRRRGSVGMNLKPRRVNFVSVHSSARKTKVLE
jgi:hypothetical protein